MTFLLISAISQFFDAGFSEQREFNVWTRH